MRSGGAKERGLKKNVKKLAAPIFLMKFDVILEVILVTFSRKKRCKNRMKFRTRKKTVSGRKKRRLLESLGGDKHQFELVIPSIS